MTFEKVPENCQKLSISTIKYKIHPRILVKINSSLLQYLYDWTPVERVVEVWEDPHEEGWVGGLEVVPDHVEDGEHDVEAVRQVQADQDLVEAVPHLRPRQEI